MFLGSDFFLRFWSFGDGFLFLKTSEGLEIYAMCYSLEISIYTDDKKAKIFWVKLQHNCNFMGVMGSML